MLDVDMADVHDSFDTSQRMNTTLADNEREMLIDNDQPFIYIDRDEKPAIVQTASPPSKETKAKNYNCDVCDTVFSHSSSIREHMQQHKRSRPLHCIRCDQYFVLGASLREHNMQHQLKDSVFCPECGKRFRTVECLMLHKKSHEMASYECGICLKKFSQSSSLISHIWNHTQLPTCECELCHKNHKSLKHLQYHKMKEHHIYDVKLYPFKCSFCPVRFRKWDTMSKHVWIQHKTIAKVYRRRKSQQSDKVGSKSAWNKVIPVPDHGAKINMSLTNNLENRVEVRKYQAAVQIKLNEKTTNQTNNILSGTEKLYVSENMINNVSLQPQGAFENGKTKVNEQIDDLTETGDGKIKQLLYECELDGYPVSSHVVNTGDKLREFIDSFVAEVMKESTIENPEMKTYTCDLCFNKFDGPETIKSHMALHTKLPPHYCTRCDIYFVLAKNLKAHLIQHELEDPSICQLCNQVFQTPSGLESHRLTHEEYHPYRCDVCPRRFQTQNMMNLHMRFHNKKLYDCSICQESLPTKSKLQEHRRKVHFIYEDKKYRYSCDLCQMKFAGKIILNRHKRYFHKCFFHCDHCEAKFKTPAGLKTHKKNAHSIYK